MTTSQVSRLGDAPEEGIKAPVKTISSGPLVLFGIGQIIAGYTIADNDRIAVNGQVDSKDNGIYTARLGKDWVRTSDFDGPDDVINGQLLVDANTSGVYSILVASGVPWNAGIDAVDFGLLLTPAGFFWGAIGGTLANQGDLQLALDDKAALVHTHVESDITNLQAYILDAAGSIANDGNFYGRVDNGWAALNFAAFAAAVHTHVEADITNLQPYLLDGPIDGLFYARKDGNWSEISTAAGTTGEVVAWPHEDVPQDFLACNGQSVNAVTFGALFAVIGYRYGGAGANFNLPDLRGQFVRGWANGSGQDPDRLARTSSGDGTTGDMVGTRQSFQIQAHAHSDVGREVGDADGSPGGQGFSGSHQTGSTGGSETRPRNVYMQYIIRYAGGGSGDASVPAVAIQDNGVELTAAAELLNFVNFELSLPVAGQVDIVFGVSKAAGIYSPGYTSYTRVDDNELTVDLVNAVNIFYPGRRIRITDDMGDFTFGVVSAVDFNVTSANDTHITLVMDGAEVVPATIGDVALVSSSTQWSPISTDPFGGDGINDIATGEMGGQQWWVAVGNSGKLATSTDAGLNWTIRVTGTTENLTGVAFGADINEFLACGNTGLLLSTVDGSTWVLDTTTIPPLLTGGSGDIAPKAIARSGENEWAVFFRRTALQWRIGFSQGAGAWGTGDTQNVANVGNTPFFGMEDNGNFIFLSVGIDDVSELSDLSDLTASVLISNIFGSSATLLGWADVYSAGLVRRGCWGADDGRVVMSDDSVAVSTDSVTFVNRHNAMARSLLHARTVTVGDAGQIGYIDDADRAVANGWTSVPNGFDPIADINCVAFNEIDGVFIAAATNGQICRSSNGAN